MEFNEVENESTTPEVTESSESSAGTPEQTKQPEMVDLDSLEKFRYSGQEMTPKELQRMIMAQSDYTRKTQAIAEERKYYDNLEVDLKAVKANPQMIAQFKSVYPEKYHKFLEYVTPAQAAQAAAQVGQGQTMDPAIADRLQRLESEIHERKVANIEAELDSKFKGLSQKYDMADEEAVIARAQALLEKGEKLTDQVWDKVWKSVHDRNKNLAESYYSKKVQQQKTASSKGKDMGAGGGTPGTAPKSPRSIKEMNRLIQQDLENS